MKCVRAKLHSSSGASMVMALVFLLICLMVGAVILTAAASNAGRMSHARASQQNYLTVSSAARLLRNELEGLTYVTGEKKEVDSGPDGGTTYSYLNGSVLPSADTMPGQIKSLAEQMLWYRPVYYPTQGDSPGDITLTVNDSGSIFDGVSATLSIDEDYNITFAFSLTDSPDSYPLRLAFTAAVQESTSTSVSYYDVTVREDVEGVPTDVTYTYDITTTTRTVTVTWADGVISKGG